MGASAPVAKAAHEATLTRQVQVQREQSLYVTTLSRTSWSRRCSALNSWRWKWKKQTQTDRHAVYITLTCRPEWRHLLRELIGKHKVCVGSQMESTGGYLLSLTHISAGLDKRGCRQSAQEPILKVIEGPCRNPIGSILTSPMFLTSTSPSVSAVILDAICHPQVSQKIIQNLHCLPLTVPRCTHFFVFNFSFPFPPCWKKVSLVTYPPLWAEF